MEGKGGSERNCEVCELGFDEGRSVSEGGVGICDIVMELFCVYGDVVVYFYFVFFFVGGLFFFVVYVYCVLCGGVC